MGTRGIAQRGTPPLAGNRKQDGEGASKSPRGTESGSMIRNKMKEMDRRKEGKATKQGEKRKSDDYGSRDGLSLVGSYRSGIGKQFVVWYCNDAFTEGNTCVDGVCGRCKVNDENKEHSCKNCNQKLSDYKYEDNQKMMGRMRDNWEGPAPEKCAICMIIM